MSKIDTIVVGAGPYGLSIAAHLRAANVDFRVFGRPMESWRTHMPIGMVLKSEPFATNLSDPARQYTFERFHASRGTAYQPSGAPIPITDFIEYADWFRRHAVPEIKDAKVSSINSAPNGFDVVLDDGETLSARNVVLATGHLAYRRIPDQLGHLPSKLMSHAADHRDLSGFAGKDMTIVGAGQSGLESAALLHELGANVRVLARAPVIDWNPELDLHPSLPQRLRHPDSGLGPGWRSWLNSELPQLFSYLPVDVRERVVAIANGPAGAWWLKSRVIGKCELQPSSEIEAATERNGKLDLTVRTGHKARSITTDHVLLGTGYNVDVNRLKFLDPGLRAAIKVHRGAPVLNSAYESTVPGLHFVGISAALSFGPVMRFVHGTKHPAAAVAAHIRALAPEPAWTIPQPVRNRPAATANPR